MNKTILFSLLLSVLSLSGCINDNTIQSSQFDITVVEENNYSDILFKNEDEAYLLGSKMGEIKTLDNGDWERVDSAIVLKTLDGGKKWKNYLLGPGKITAFAIGTDSTIYMVKRIENLNKFQSLIYLYNKKKDYWEHISEIDKDIMNLKVIGNKWICNARIGDNFKLLISNDKGRSWNVLKTNLDVFEPIFLQDKLIYLSRQNKSIYFDMLISYNIDNNTSIEEKLPPGFVAYQVGEHNDRIYLIGRINDRVRIYQRKSKNNYQPVYEFPNNGRVFSKQLILNKHSWVVVIGERKDGYVEDHILISTDQGLSWSAIPVKNSYYNGPIAAYDTERGYILWRYCGSGNLQRIVSSN